MISYFVTYQAYSSAVPPKEPVSGSCSVEREKPIADINEVTEIADSIRRRLGYAHVTILDWRRFE